MKNQLIKSPHPVRIADPDPQLAIEELRTLFTVEKVAVVVMLVDGRELQGELTLVSGTHIHILVDGDTVRIARSLILDVSHSILE